MTVNEPQFVTILITPVIWATNFFIELYLDDAFIASSDKMLFTEWIQIYISPEDFKRKNNNTLELKLKIKVDQMDCGILSLFGCRMEYYLHVVGSTQFMLRRPHIQYSGPYIKNCN